MPSLVRTTSRKAAESDPGNAAEGSSPRRPERRIPGWLVAGLPVIAALAAGGYRLGSPSLWRDEAYTLEVERRSFGQILRMLPHVDAIHGPYYLGLHAVVSLLGTSAVALRLPSLIATALAAGALAIVGQRLAALSGLPVPALTGLLAGLLYAAAPQTTYYAQDARPYGLVTLFAVTATGLLIAAVRRGGARWWAGYAAAILATGLMSAFALLILAAHLVTLLLITNGTRLRPWLAAVAAASAGLSPLLVLGYRQSATLSWVTRPGPRDVITLLRDFAGSGPLVLLVGALAAGGIASGLRPGRLRELTVVTVALPWLVLPPVILVAISLVKPVYVERYVVFCQPALALLCAAGLAWLGRVLAATRPARRTAALAWAGPAAILVLLAVLLTGPQESIRLTSARPDNLRGVSAVVAANARPGDAVFYLPSAARVVSMGYPAPFRQLRDLALDQSPTAADDLTGTQVQAPELASRFAGVHRVWVVQWADELSQPPVTNIGREELALVRPLHLVRRWTVQSVVLSLYAR